MGIFVAVAVHGAGGSDGGSDSGSGAGGSDGGSCAGGPVVVMVAVTVALCALVGGSKSITMSGFCGNMMVTKE